MNLTQEEAAAEADVSVRTWRDLESGKTAPTLETIEKLIDGLNWSWAEILGVFAPTATDSETPVEIRRLLDQAWLRATARERDVIKASLRVLAGGRRSRSSSKG